MGYALELPLDPRAAAEVVELRRILETAGVPTLTASIGEIPHVSLGVFDDDVDPLALERLLHALAEEATPLALRFGGVGMFVEPQPVIYLEPDQSGSLQALHERFFSLLGATTTSLSAHYRPEHWQPHCTIAMEFEPDLLDEAGEVVRRRFSRVDALCSSLQLVRFRPVEVLEHRTFRGSRLPRQRG